MTVGDNTKAELDRLAGCINKDIADREQGAAAWVEATLALCTHLAEAKAMLTDTYEFGKWCEIQDFKLNHQDRAAAIAMGQDPTRARTVLEATERRSLQHIHSQEFRVTHMSNSPSPSGTIPVSNKPSPTVVTPRPKNLNAKRQRAFAAVAQAQAAGVTLTKAQIAAQAQVSDTVVRAVMTTIEAEERIKAEVLSETATELEQLKIRLSHMEPLIALSEDIASRVSRMTIPERKKWDKQTEAARYEIERMVQQRFAASRQKWEEETGIALYMARLDKIEKMFTAWPHSVMRKDEYQIIMRCLHPDTAHSRTPEQLGEAFRLFTYYKMKMLNDEEERRNARRELRSGMPKTLEEMEARRKNKGDGK